jgi:cytochrome c-type biogenesis protein CcmH
MTCQNQSIYDSNSDFAQDIKILVEDKFKEGLSEKEIKVFLTKRYGEYILFKPYFNIKNLLLWLFHFILLLFSLGFFIKNLKKN